MKSNILRVSKIHLIKKINNLEFKRLEINRSPVFRSTISIQVTRAPSIIWKMRTLSRTHTKLDLVLDRWSLCLGKAHRSQCPCFPQFINHRGPQKGTIARSRGLAKPTMMRCKTLICLVMHLPERWSFKMRSNLLKVKQRNPLKRQADKWITNWT
jgi:hypothetical protein